MILYFDTRNQKDWFIRKQLEARGFVIKNWGLPYGDIMRTDNMLKAIDIKASGGGVLEIARNICSKDHNRLRREILRCAENTGGAGELIFLICTDEAKNIGDLANWQSPLRKSGNQKGQPFTKVKGEMLAKALTTMSEDGRYGCKVRFEFATKENAWHRVIELLDLDVKT